MIPRHRLTAAAINQAKILADLFCPANDEQAVARNRIMAAVRNGDLHHAMNAVQKACTVGRRGLATLEWREWAKSWLSKCDRLILADLGQVQDRAA